MRFLKTLVLAIVLLGSATVANAMRFNIDRDVVSDNGCRFHIHGWVNVNWSGDVDHYDLSVSSPCGNFHFHAISVNPATGSPTGDDQPVGTFSIHVSRLEDNVEVIDYPFSDDEIMRAAREDAGQ